MSGVIENTGKCEQCTERRNEMEESSKENMKERERKPIIMLTHSNKESEQIWEFFCSGFVMHVTGLD